MTQRKTANTNARVSIRWQKFLERKFVLAVGGIVTGVLVAFGRQEEADALDKVLGSVISMGMALGWIAAETSRDNIRDKLSVESSRKDKSPK